jgi:arylsulfatase A-like enzyme
VALLDHRVGQILEKLKAEDMYDDTLIVFTSDHGEMLGSHCLWQKRCLYEEATRVPLAFKLPGGLPFAPTSTELVSHGDVLPTLCEMSEMLIDHMQNTGDLIRFALSDYQRFLGDYAPSR